MRILLISHRFPWPLHRGDTLTVYKLAEYFGRRHEVDLLCHEPQDSADLLRVQPLVRHVTTVPFGKLQAAARVLWAIFSGKPLQVAWCSSAGILSLAEALGAERDYDVVVAYYIRTADVGLRVPGIRVLAMQLAMSQQWRRSAAVVRTPWKRALHRTEAIRLLRFERSMAQRYDYVTLISDRDVQAIGIDSGRVFLNPHGVDIELNSFSGVRDRHGIVFSGLMSFGPNVDSVVYFVREILPLIRDLAGDTEVTIVGRDPAPEVRSLTSIPGVEVTGMVPEVAPYLQAAAVAVAPIRIAAGLQNKVLESLSCGTPTVMTSTANEGLQVPTPQCCLVADNPPTFARAVVALLNDPERRAEMGRSARSWIEKNWTWDHHLEILENAILERVGR